MSITKDKLPYGYIGTFGEDYKDTSTFARFYDDDYAVGEIGFKFYSKENVKNLRLKFQAAMLQLGYNVGLQEETAVLDQMHEAFWEIHDLMYQRKRARTNANLYKNSIKGWEFNPDDNEKRGIPKCRPEYVPPIKPIYDRHSEEITFEHLFKILNDKALDNMIRIAREKIATYENWQKMYNRKVDEHLRSTTFSRRPESEGSNRQRRPPVVNLFRFKPRTYIQDIIKW